MRSGRIEWVHRIEIESQAQLTSRLDRNVPLHQLIPLELLAAGEQGRIHDVDGNRDLVTRLAEMGLREGAEVRMIRPGRPCIIAIANHRLSFRGDDSAVVLVETCPA